MKDMSAKKVDIKRKLLEKLKNENTGSPDMLEGMKVSVMAKDEKGLKEGLDKAKEILENKKLEELFKSKYKK